MSIPPPVPFFPLPVATSRAAPSLLSEISELLFELYNLHHRCYVIQEARPVACSPSTKGLTDKLLRYSEFVARTSVLTGFDVPPLPNSLAALYALREILWTMCRPTTRGDEELFRAIFRPWTEGRASFPILHPHAPWTVKPQYVHTIAWMVADLSHNLSLLGWDHQRTSPLLYVSGCMGNLLGLVFLSKLVREGSCTIRPKAVDSIVADSNMLLDTVQAEAGGPTILVTYAISPREPRNSFADLILERVIRSRSWIPLWLIRRVAHMDLYEGNWERAKRWSEKGIVEARDSKCMYYAARAYEHEFKIPRAHAQQSRINTLYQLAALHGAQDAISRLKYMWSTADTSLQLPADSSATNEFCREYMDELAILQEMPLLDMLQAYSSQRRRYVNATKTKAGRVEDSSSLPHTSIDVSSRYARGPVSPAVGNRAVDSLQTWLCYEKKDRPLISRKCFRQANEAVRLGGDPRYAFNKAESYRIGCKGSIATSQTSALKLYARAALEGHAAANFMLAKMIEGDTRNERRKSSLFYQVAAMRGHGEASFALGILLEKGSMDGGLRRAFEFHEAASKNNHTEGMKHTARLLETGDGCEQVDQNKALDLYATAASKGDKAAVIEFVLLAESMRKKVQRG